MGTALLPPPPWAAHARVSCCWNRWATTASGTRIHWRD